MPTIQREVRKRSVIGKMFKWIFVAFNLLMVFWIIAYWVKLSDMSQSIVTDAEKTGAAVGGTIGTGMLIFIWVAGSIILGLFTLMTRGSKILITEER